MHSVGCFGAGGLPFAEIVGVAVCSIFIAYISEAGIAAVGVASTQSSIVAAGLHVMGSFTKDCTELKIGK